MPTGAMEFNFGGHVLRAVVSGAEVWFVAAEVCAILEHSDSSKAVSRLEDDERGVTTVRTLGGDQSVNVVSESGLYALIMTSRKPQARAFRRWVTGEVLPTLRRTGSYAIPGHTAESVAVTLSARRPSRYIVTLLPDQPPHVRRTDPEAIIDAMDTLDARVLCYTLKLIECWWHQTGEIRSIGSDPAGGLPFEQLESTILNGSALADRFLSFGRKPKSG